MEEGEISSAGWLCGVSSNVISYIMSFAQQYGSHCTDTDAIHWSHAYARDQSLTRELQSAIECKHHHHRHHFKSYNINALSSSRILFTLVCSFIKMHWWEFKWSHHIVAGTFLWFIRSIVTFAFSIDSIFAPFYDPHNVCVCVCEVIPRKVIHRKWFAMLLFDATTTGSAMYLLNMTSV